MKPTYDPLRILIKQNANERAAYELGEAKGLDRGIDLATTEDQEDRFSFHHWLVKRIEYLDKLRGESSRRVFLKGLSPLEAYIAALEDVEKHYSRGYLFESTPSTV